MPFPTHVIDRVEVRDHVTGHTFIQTYRYRHGYFDGPEREFRGFGMVEVEDTESWEDYNAPKLFPTGHQIVDEALHSPPVRTRTWFHTGAYLGETSLSRCYADEYYSDKTLDNPNGIAIDLQDTVLPHGLTPIERREAVRALRGRALRVEVYGLDGSAQAEHPYSVAETNFEVRRLQPRDGEQSAAFLVHDLEAISYSYERDPSLPRVAHKMVIAVDDFGNVLKSASIAYGQPILGDARAEQKGVSIVYNEADVVNVAASATSYRLGVPVESRAYEITGLAGDLTNTITRAELVTDPLGNTITVSNDYRVLAPKLVTDPNGNRQAVAFDALGMVIKTAVMGKVGDSDGDTLDDPTTELAYDLFTWIGNGKPVVVHAIARETHGPAATAFQESYTYSGGLGQVVVQKAKAEPGLAPKCSGIAAQVPGTGAQVPGTGAQVPGTGAQVLRNPCPSARNGRPDQAGIGAQVRPESVPKSVRKTHATLSPQPARPIGPVVQLRGR